MKATYKQFPGLEFLKSEKEFKKLINYCDTEELSIKFKDEDFNLVRSNVFYLTDSFASAARASEESLCQLVCPENYKPDLSLIYKQLGYTCGAIIGKGMYENEKISSVAYYKITDSYLHITSFCTVPGKVGKPMCGICVLEPDFIYKVGMENEFVNLFDNEDAIEETLKTTVLWATFILLFKKYADIETKIIDVVDPAKTPKNICKSLALQNTPVDFQITQLSTDWYTEIIRTEEFAVRGHWRLQPYANGVTKLIFINPFMKYGYHRKAKLQIEREKEGMN